MLVAGLDHKDTLTKEAREILAQPPARRRSAAALLPLALAEGPAIYDGVGAALLYINIDPFTVPQSAHVNTCATLFAAQALASAVPGAPPIPWYHLV